MFQPLPLLLEVILLGATAYLFWLTRKAASDVERRIEFAIKEAEKKGAVLGNVKMAQDVSRLLSELQSTAGEMRAEWTRQNITLQETLKRAKMAEASLNGALALANVASPSLPVAATPPTRPQMAAPLTLGDAIALYGKHLSTKGRNDAAVSRTLGHIKNFVHWWGGQRYEQVLLRRIDAAETESYFDYLRAQNYRPATIKRKMRTLKTFINWANTLLTTAREASTPAAVPTPPAPQKAEATPAARRRQTVLALAKQGLDLRAIAAKIGMEQEAVRMILATEF